MYFCESALLFIFYLTKCIEGIFDEEHIDTSTEIYTFRTKIDASFKPLLFQLFDNSFVKCVRYTCNMATIPMYRYV